MPRETTVIVVGAGASQEAGLPTTPQLKRTIANYLDMNFERRGTLGGDSKIAQILHSRGDLNQALRACQHISVALPQAMSIDNFIDAHQGNSEIEFFGKLAIVRAILEAEKSSRMYVDPSNINNRLNFRSLEETWFNMFWQRISENCQVDGLSARLASVVFIVFNYDRCIEHFLYHSIRNYYGLPDNEAASLVNAMQVFHPYGMVGSLPWTGGASPMEFGAEPISHELLRLVEQIKTFTEGTDPEASDIAAIRSHVAQADTLVFLGFAYHPQNLELLKRTGERSPHQGSVARCIGTAVGISDADFEAIGREVEQYSGALLSPNQERNLTCSALFDTYRRALSFV